MNYATFMTWRYASVTILSLDVFRHKMYNGRCLALSMAVLVTLQIQLCAGTNENDIIKFIYNRIPLLRAQARSNGHFSAIVLLSETEVKNISQFKFLPHHTDGSAYVNNSQPFSPESPQNYIVARPNALSEESVMHAEVILLEQLPRAWNSFLGRGQGRPAMILFFTRFYPCTPSTPEDSRQRTQFIRNALGRAPYNSIQSRVFAYNADEDEESCAPHQQIQNMQFMREGIMVDGLPMLHCFQTPEVTLQSTRMRRSSHGDLCPVPSRVQTLQGCLLQCLTDSDLMDDILTCIKDSAALEEKAYLVNFLINQCLLNEDSDCFKNVFLRKIGSAPACPSIQKYSIANLLGPCHQQCSLKPISKPQTYASSFDNAPVLMTSPAERKGYFSPTTFDCKHRRQTGFLCSTWIPCSDSRQTLPDCEWNSRYLTAKSTLCRPGHPCGYHGYDYTWCYTSWHDDWEYCCSGSCGYHGSDYQWCQAGSEWQYCNWDIIIRGIPHLTLGGPTHVYLIIIGHFPMGIFTFCATVFQ